MAKNKILTLVLVHNAKQVLLGMKKRGFGVGRWNGFGGKVEQNESIVEAAKRYALAIKHDLDLFPSFISLALLFIFWGRGLDYHVYAEMECDDENIQKKMYHKQFQNKNFISIVNESNVMILFVLSE